MEAKVIAEERAMSKLARMTLLLSFWVCCPMFLHNPSGSAEPIEELARERPGATFGGAFRRMLGDDPSTLDPASVTDIYGRAVINQIFDGLVQFDANLNPIPAIAEFWEASRDGLTWTFILRRGVKFHHGREVTAQDVVYSFTRLLRLRSPGPVTEIFEHIQGAKPFMQGEMPHVEGLKATDRYSLQIVLEQPLAPFLPALGLTNAAIVPEEKLEPQDERFGHHPVGTGPFKFVRWKSKNEIVLEANDHYYEGRPFLDRVVFKIFPGAELKKTFAEFLKGNLEETIIPSEEQDEVRTEVEYRKFQRIRKPTLSLLYLGFNTRLKPFDDERVRQAFNYAVNTQAIVREITKRGSLPATGILPPGMAGYDPHLQGYSYQPAKAMQLLAEAGYPHGVGLPAIELWSVNKAQSTQDELAAYQRDLANIGVKVDLRFASDWPTYKTMLEQGKLPMFRLLRLADIPDADNFLFPMLHSTSKTNYTFYRNPRVDNLLEQSRKELDYTQRIAFYHEAQRIIVADAVLIPQHHSTLDYLYQPYVQGVEVSLLGKRFIPLKKIWFKKSLTTGPTAAITDVQPSR
jgi:peptide/nickel transport system substrate-binding protein/oligopeptide transport system substrate-binding protein